MSSKCDNCGIDITKNNTKTVIFSLKRGNKAPNEKWCLKCYENEKDDFCTYCGCNSLGSIPCSACRQECRSYRF